MIANSDLTVISDTHGSATPRLLGQRDAYFNALFEIFKRDKNCILITADNGAPSLDQFSRELPEQFIQVGIAEQQMIGMAAGLAIEGKRVWTYCIAPFATTRVHEFVKIDIAASNLPVTILGIGAGLAYQQMGPTHYTLEDISIMRVLPNLEIWSPVDSVCAAALARHVYERKRPAYIRFDRSGIPDIYDDDDIVPLGTGMHAFFGEADLDFPDCVIISTGIMTHQALKVAKKLGNAQVYDLLRLKPIDSLGLLTTISPSALIVTLEEHFLAGGLGSMIAEALVDSGMSNKLLRLGRTDAQGFCFDCGGREKIWADSGLDVDSVVNRIKVYLNQS